LLQNQHLSVFVPKLLAKNKGELHIH